MLNFDSKSQTFKNVTALFIKLHRKRISSKMTISTFDFNAPTWFRHLFHQESKGVKFFSNFWAKHFSWNHCSRELNLARGWISFLYWQVKLKRRTFYLVSGGESPYRLWNSKESCHVSVIRGGILRLTLNTSYYICILPCNAPRIVVSFREAWCGVSWKMLNERGGLKGVWEGGKNP